MTARPDLFEVEEDSGKGQKQVRNRSETPKRQHLPSHGLDISERRLRIHTHILIHLPRLGFSIYIYYIYTHIYLGRTCIIIIIIISIIIIKIEINWPGTSLNLRATQGAWPKSYKPLKGGCISKNPNHPQRIVRLLFFVTCFRTHAI